jgi:RimJ/RimL family protein N-acetyltransferase
MLYEKSVTLKNGQSCLLRSPRASDAQAILDHMRLTSGETDNMLRYPDEVRMTPEQEAAYLEQIAAAPNAVMIAAELDGALVANGGFNPVSALDKCRHRCELGISIRESCWHLGLGTAIIEGLIGCARQAGYLQMELDAVEDNARAVALYERFGFTRIGVNPRAFRLRSGAYQGLLLMRLELD